MPLHQVSAGQPQYLALCCGSSSCSLLLQTPQEVVRQVKHRMDFIPMNKITNDHKYHTDLVITSNGQKEHLTIHHSFIRDYYKNSSDSTHEVVPVILLHTSYFWKRENLAENDIGVIALASFHCYDSDIPPVNLLGRTAGYLTEQLAVALHYLVTQGVQASCGFETRGTRQGYQPADHTFCARFDRLVAILTFLHQPRKQCLHDGNDGGKRTTRRHYTA